MITKRTLRAQNEELRVSLAKANEQRDKLLAHAVLHDDIPPGIYGPLSRPIQLEHPSGVKHLAPGDTFEAQYPA